MNYQTNLKQTYSIDIDGFSQNVGAIALLESGAQLEINESTDISYDYDAQLYYYVNYVHRELTQDEVAMLLVKTPYNLTLCCSTKVDYVLMHSYVGEVLSAYSKRQNGSYYQIGDGAILYNYPQYNPNSNISDFNYGAYNVAFDDDYAVYDFSSVQNENINNYRSDSLYLRGENLSFYNSYLSFYDLNSNYALTLSYGSPIFEIGNTEYDRGYNNGYTGGYTNGYNDGYGHGINSHTDQYTYNAFGYIGQAFNAVGSILTLEVLPHVTLGLCFSIPLVIVLIMTIFKLVRK